MWMSFVPLARMKSSAAMCCVLPTPTEAKRYSPGLAFRSARSSSMLRAGTPVFTTTTLGTTTTRPTGWMSFCASKPSLIRCGAIACPVLVATMRVWPSGAALAVKSAASVFDAPGRFSTTNGCLKRSANLSASRREMMSMPPPGEAPAMIFTGPAQEGERGDDQQGHELQLLEAVGPDADDEAEQAEGHCGQQEKHEHPGRMGDAQRHEQARRGEDDKPQDHRLGRGRADVARHDLEIRDRRRQDLVDRAGEPGKVDAERGVRDALRQQHQHRQPRHDEGAVAHSVDLGDARADGRAEHHEVQRRRNHRGDDALQQRAAGARHLEYVDRPDRAVVHYFCRTRSTKMSSRELCVVWRSLKPMPAWLRSSSSDVMPVRSRCVS